MFISFNTFEEDSSREFDAFVSYSSSDSDMTFVINTLVPRLEEHFHFKLCIHQRNFTAGSYISDNIAEAVHKSRRTILVISPDFINSAWCKFEYQVALQEMMLEKHRIIPIILGKVGDINSLIDPTLKTVLSVVTWLEYPGQGAPPDDIESFWKRLELSMPKKRPTTVSIIKDVV